MSASQRRKGARGELEACGALADALGGEWSRGGSAQRRHAGPRPADVESATWPRLWVEVKRGARPSLWAALEQAVSDAAAAQRLPIALVRRDRDLLGWVVVVRLADLLPLVRMVCDHLWPSGRGGL